MKESPKLTAYFDPRDPAWRGRLWMWTTLEEGGRRLHIFWRRVAVLSVMMGLGLWLFVAGAVRANAARLEIPGVRFADIVLPWRWPYYLSALGAQHWENARLALARDQVREAISLLLACLRHTPSHAEARRELAVSYIRIGHLRFAAACLEDGLGWRSDDLDQLKLLFGVLDETQEDARALGIAERLLPAKPTGRLSDLFVALQAAGAHYHSGRYDAAEDIVLIWGLERSIEGQLLLARCDAERGHPLAALDRLATQAERFPGRDELELERLRLLRELGHRDEWRRQTLLRTFALPDGAGPRADWLAALREAASPRLAEERERFLVDLAADARAVVLLAWEAADAAEPALAHRVRQVAEAAGHRSNAFVLIEIQALLAAGQAGPALAFAEAAREQEAEQNPHYAPALAGLTALAHYATGDAARGDLELAAFVNHDGVRATDGVLLARQLRRLGAESSARRALTAAVNHDPLNQAATTELVLLLAQQGRWDEIESPLRALLAMRKPSRGALEEVALHLFKQPSDTAPEVRAALTDFFARPAPDARAS
jgi:hypothetical protein